METYYIVLLLLISTILLTLYFFERSSRIASEKNNKALESRLNQLDEQAKIIIKTDLTLNKVQEELDRKITGLYTLHELGKKINSTFNVEDLFTLITQPLVSKLGFSKALIMFKDAPSGRIIIKTSIRYSDADITRIESELNKGNAANPLLKKSGFVLVNRDMEKIEKEDLFLEIFTAKFIIKEMHKFCCFSFTRLSIETPNNYFLLL